MKCLLLVQELTA